MIHDNCYNYNCLYTFIDTLLKSVDNHACASCAHYMIDYDVFVHPPLHDTEKVIDHFMVMILKARVVTVYY